MLAGLLDVVIRSNSDQTSLLVKAPLDKVSHYGLAGTIDLQKVATSSYYEHGTVGFVELTEGRIVLTKDSDVEIINVTKKDDNTYYNPIIADGGVLDENMPDIISRDQVTVIGTKTELVQIQTLDADGNVTGTSEQVYAYSNGATNKGSTVQVKTGDNKQNADVTTTLGYIVLDSASGAGEKAYSSDQKKEAQETAELDAGNKIALEENPDAIFRIGQTLYSDWNTVYAYLSGIGEDPEAEPVKCSLIVLRDFSMSQAMHLDLGNVNLTVEGCGYTFTNTYQYVSGGDAKSLRGFACGSRNYEYYRPAVTVNNLTILGAQYECFYATDTIDLVLNNCNGETKVWQSDVRSMITYNESVLAASYSATLTVNGGTFTSTGYGASIYSTGGEITLNNCTLTADKEISYCYVPSSGDSTTNSTIKINGGTYKGTSIYNGSGTWYKSYIAETYINAGTFTVNDEKVEDVKGYVVSGKTVTINGKSYTK